MSRQIKSTLFRFATMRAPELIDVSQQELLTFVKHPNIAKSVFLNATENVSKKTAQKIALQKTASEFNEESFQTIDDIKKVVNQDFYNFSKWFISNRVHLTSEETIKKLGEIQPIKDDLIIQIWDNLFYQIVTYNSGTVRETLFTLLLVNFFVQNVNKVEKTDEAYQKLAQARIVIPNNLFGKETIIGKTDSNITSNTSSLDKELNTIVLNDKIQYLSKIKKDIEKLKKTYDKKQKDAYDAAYKLYQDEVKVIYDNVKPNEQLYTDPDINVQKKYISYDPVNIPEFTFEKTPEVIQKVEKKSSINETQSFINELVDSEGYSTYDELITHVSDEMNTTTETLFEETTLEDSIVSYNGTLVPITSDLPIGALFSISGTHITPTTLLFNTDFFNAYVVSANYDLRYQVDGTSYPAQSFSDSIINNKLSVQIFTNNEVNIITSSNGKPTLGISGEFILSNDTKVTFTGKARLARSIGHVFEYAIIGNGSYTVKNITDDNTSPLEYIPSGHGIKRLGIADYRKVEQTVCCYVPGEVSHIENIMAREFKEKETRRLRRREDTIATTKEKETEHLTDTTSTDRFEMNQETSSVIAEDRQFNAHAGVTAKYEPITITAGADFSTATSSETSNAQSVTYAKDVTERALERVVQKVKEERTIKIVEEFEEKNVHGFDNRQGENHISGVYRWIDKIYKNQVINYGKRLMYEFMIPEPASFHNIAIKGEANNSGDILVKPKDPRTFAGVLNLKNYTKINENTYSHWAGVYNAEVNAPPSETLKIGKALSFTTPETNSKEWDEAAAGSEDIFIPEGYKSSSARVKWHRSNEGGIGMQVSIGGRNVGSSSIVTVSGFEGSIAVSYDSLGYHTGNVNVELTCTLTSEAKKQWQIETFNAIISAYENKLAEYESKATEATEDFGVNPGFFRQIENTVLRKNCIEYLASQAQIGNNFIVNRDNVQTVRANYENEALETYAARVKFFEQAFEWNIMSYNFYPFYWADKSKWKSLYKVTEFNDPLHRSFLQSGMARVIVTVRPGFEEVVNWYMATGQIWNGGQVPTMDDELFLSIVEELKETEGAVEDTWESRVPTSLTVIQAGAIGLNVEGLPCNEDCDDFKLFDSDNNEILDADGNSFTNPIQQNSSLIGESETSNEIKADKQYPFTIIYNEKDNDNNDHEFKFKVLNKSGDTLILGTKKYYTEALALKALNYAILQIIDAPEQSIQHTTGTDNKWHYRIFDVNKTQLARSTNKYSTEANSKQSAEQLIEWLLEITQE